jgi:hypothetical protein
MIEQNGVEGWSEEEEASFQALLKKRMSLRRGKKGHDVRFASDMLFGEAGERTLVEAMQKAEVKTIKEVSRNGKIFVEHENYGKPSGINTTDADWWVFMLGGPRYSQEVFIGVHSDRLRRLVEPLDFDPPCGQNKASVGKRLNLPELLLPDYRIK